MLSYSVHHYHSSVIDVPEPNVIDNPTRFEEYDLSFLKADFG